MAIVAIACLLLQLVLALVVFTLVWEARVLFVDAAAVLSAVAVVVENAHGYLTAAPGCADMRVSTPPCRRRLGISANGCR